MALSCWLKALVLLEILMPLEKSLIFYLRQTATRLVGLVMSFARSRTALCTPQETVAKVNSLHRGIFVIFASYLGWLSSAPL